MKNKTEEAEAEDRLISSLEHVEQYLDLQGAVAAILRNGWFNVARARHAMGINRVSSTSYNSVLEAQTRFVSGLVPENESHHMSCQRSQQSPQQQQQQQTEDVSCSKGDTDAASETLQSYLQSCGTASDSPADIGAPKAAVPQHETRGNESMQTSPGEMGCRVEIGSLRGCLHMFGATPSPYLRTAQSDFVAAIRLLPRLVKAQQQLGQLGRVSLASAAPIPSNVQHE